VESETGPPNIGISKKRNNVENRDATINKIINPCKIRSVFVRRDFFVPCRKYAEMINPIPKIQENTIIIKNTLAMKDAILLIYAHFLQSNVFRAVSLFKHSH
jgi:hypothetical protein